WGRGVRLAASHGGCEGDRPPLAPSGGGTGRRDCEDSLLPAPWGNGTGLDSSRGDQSPSGRDEAKAMVVPTARRAQRVGTEMTDAGRVTRRIHFGAAAKGTREL